MNNNDFNFEQFIKLLDGALASDDKNVKQALRKFLFVAAMVMGDNTESGPFTKMMETIDNLQQRISTLENKDNYTFTSTAPDITTWTNGTITPSTTGYYSSGSLSGSAATTDITSIAYNSGTTNIFTSPNSFLDPSGTDIKEEIMEGINNLAKQD